MKNLCFLLIIIVLLLALPSYADDSWPSTPEFEACYQDCDKIKLEVYFPEGCEPDTSATFGIIKISMLDTMNDIPNVEEYITISLDIVFNNNKKIGKRLYRVIDFSPDHGEWTYYLFEQLDEETQSEFFSSCTVTYDIPDTPCDEDAEEKPRKDEETDGCSTSENHDMTPMTLIVIMVLIGIAAHVFSGFRIRKKSRNI